MNVALKHTAAEEALLAMGKSADAVAKLQKTGLPSRRVEAWHYTDLRNLLKTVPDAAGVVDADKVAESFSAYKRLTHATRLPFMNGSYISSLADETPAGVLVSYDDAKSGKPGADDDAIGLINAIAGSSGLSITVKDGTKIDKPIGLAQMVGDTVYCGTQHSVAIGKDAKISVIERHLSDDGVAGQGNAITHLSVGENSEVLWAIVQEHGDSATHLGQLNVSLAKGARLTVLALNCGGKLVRQEINVDSNGEGAHLEILGVNLVGEGAHIDVTTRLSHNVPNTTANETFRNVVTGNGKGVFQGQIKVAQPAQKTDAQMACNTLLLSDDADFSAKPELEIFADDVICAHGATVTDIDEEQLFYLRARGIPEMDARALLVKAFVDEIFDDLEDETFKDALVGLIDEWLDNNG